MNNLIVFEYLNNLSKSEFKRFENFLYSPYFNKYKTILSLFGYLKTKYPNIKKIDVTAQRISLIVYSEELVNNTKIRKLISDFKKLFGNFLFHEFCDKRSLITKVHYLEYLNTREMPEFYLANLKEAHFLLGRTNTKDDNYYLSNFKLSKFSYIHNFNFRYSKNIYSFNSCLDNIDFYFIFLKLWSFLNILIIKKTYDETAEFSNNFEKEIITFIEARSHYFSKHHHFIYMMYLFYKMFTMLDDKYYNLLLRYFESNKDKFRGKLLSEYYCYLAHYLAIKKIALNGNYKMYNKKLYYLYIEIFDSKNKCKFLFLNGKLMGYLYHHIAATYMLEGDSERALKFIYGYKKYLDKKFSEDLFNFSLGNYYYQQHDLHTSIKCFNKISSRNENFRYRRKISLLRVYFELNESGLMEAEMKNLYLLSYRSKSEDTNKQIARVFLKYFRLLVKWKYSNSVCKRNLQFEKTMLRKQIENEKQFLCFRNWFLEILEK